MIIFFTSDSKCAAENTCCKPRPPTCYHGYQVPRPQNGRKICTIECLAVAVCWWVWASGFQYQPSPWAISVRSVMLASGFSSFCRTGGGWYQWRCWMLWKSTGIHGRLRDTATVWSTTNASHQAVTCQTHWHYIATHPHSVHTLTLIPFVKKSCFFNPAMYSEALLRCYGNHVILAASIQYIHSQSL